MTTAVTTPGVMPALPAHLRAKLQPASANAGANAAIVAGIGSGFVSVPRISIEGKVFRIIVDGTGQPLMTTDDEGNQTPVTSLNVVVVDANAGKYKSWFGGVKWQPGQEAERPKCYSYDGERPSPLADAIQSETCAACPHNAWGSLINELGNKTRACSDGKLLAVIPVSAVRNKAAPDTPQGRAYQIKVSATALSRSREDRKNDPANAHSLSEYVGMLSNYPVEGGNVEVPVRNVVTRLFFGVAQYPLLQFRMAAKPWLDEAEIAYVEARAAGDDIKLLVTEQGVPEREEGAPALRLVPPATTLPAVAAPAHHAPAPAPAAPAPAPVAPAPAKPSRAPRKAVAAAAVEPVAAVASEEDEPEITIGATPAAKPAVAAAPAAQATPEGLDDALKGVSDLFN
jgi:hypothetical protein